MSTVPMGQPKQATQPGQTGLPGNTANTVPMNYNFLPHATAKDATGGGGSTVPGGTQPYTANNYITNNPNNPFNQYTGFNLGLNSADELTKMYGPLGTAMYYYLNNGAGYNPSVLTSLINQIQPQVNEGIATLGATAGMTGNRFGSAYQVGTADYLSQVNQNELGMASGLYQQSQNTINNDLVNLLGGAGQYQSNKGGFTSSLISSLLPALLNPNSNLGGSIGSLLNMIPGINIPTGGSGGSSIPGTINGGIGGGWGGINVGSQGGTNGGLGIPTSTTGTTLPNSPEIIWDSQIPTQGSAGGATAGATVDAKTGQTQSAQQNINSLNAAQIMQYINSILPPSYGGTGSYGQTDDSNSTAGSGFIPYVA